MGVGDESKMGLIAADRCAKCCANQTNSAKLFSN